jgi:hypothetical protein
MPMFSFFFITMKALFLYTLGLFLFCSASLADALTIYSYRHYESDVLLFDKFTERTGIEVEVVKSKAGALLERLQDACRCSDYFGCGAFASGARSRCVTAAKVVILGAARACQLA